MNEKVDLYIDTIDLDKDVIYMLVVPQGTSLPTKF